jgi:hypothetical protein
MYYSNNRWNDYPIGGNVAVRTTVGSDDVGTRYNVGYRGPPHNESVNPSTNPARMPDEAGMNVDAQH